MTQLTNILYQETGLKRTICKNLDGIIFGIVESRNVCLNQIAKYIRGNSLIESKTRRIQRALSKDVSMEKYIMLVLSMIEVNDNMDLVKIIDS